MNKARVLTAALMFGPLAIGAGPAAAQGTPVKLPTLVASMEEVQNLIVTIKPVLFDSRPHDAREGELKNTVQRRLPLGVQVTSATIDDAAGAATVTLMGPGFSTAISVRVS